MNAACILKNRDQKGALSALPGGKQYYGKEP